MRVLVGACDPLFTPRPLGPFVDIADRPAADSTNSWQQARFRTASLRFSWKSYRKSPTIVVLEDLHWADEATLDVVRLFARHVDTSPVLAIGTYRDDELEPGIHCGSSSAASRPSARPVDSAFLPSHPPASRSSHSHPRPTRPSCTGSHPGTRSTSRRCWRGRSAASPRPFATPSLLGPRA